MRIIGQGEGFPGLGGPLQLVDPVDVVLPAGGNHLLEIRELALEGDLAQHGPQVQNLYHTRPESKHPDDIIRRVGYLFVVWNRQNAFHMLAVDAVQGVLKFENNGGMVYELV